MLIANKNNKTYTNNILASTCTGFFLVFYAAVKYVNMNLQIQQTLYYKPRYGQDRVMLFFNVPKMCFHIWIRNKI